MRSTLTRLSFASKGISRHSNLTVQSGKYLNGEPWTDPNQEANKMIGTWDKNSQENDLQHNLFDEPVFDNFEDMNEKAHELLMKTDAVTRFSATEKNILRTSMRCEEVALQLREALLRLKHTGGAKSPMRNSFREALRAVWGEERIAILKKQLDNYRKQINSLLLVFVRHFISNSIHCSDTERSQGESGSFAACGKGITRRPLQYHQSNARDNGPALQFTRKIEVGNNPLNSKKPSAHPHE
jgi:hypothetical protein